MRNFNSLFAFLQALRESSCDESNWQGLFDLINPTRNYAFYRKIKQEAPCVPFLPPHITQLKRCQEKGLSEIFVFLGYRPGNLAQAQSLQKPEDSSNRKQLSLTPWTPWTLGDLISCFPTSRRPCSQQ